MNTMVELAEMDASLSKPAAWMTALEIPRVMQEMSMLLPTHKWLKSLPKGDGHPIIVLPGFSADNRSTAILRSYLKDWGYAVEPWALEQNLDPRDMKGFEGVIDFRESMKEVVGARIQELYETTGKQVTLLGWSLGGIFSRVLASDNQNAVRQVMTLGTPFGDPRTVPVYDMMARFQKKPMSQAHYDEWMAMCEAPLGDVKLTILFSKSDGFVSRDIANNAQGDTQEAIHVCSSHVGFAVNPTVLYLIAQRLQASSESNDWQKFLPANKLASYLYKQM